MNLDNIKALAGRIKNDEYAAIVDDVVKLDMQRDDLLWALKHIKNQIETLSNYIDYVVKKTEDGAA